MLSLVSPSSATLYGLVRIRATSSVGATVITGSGITATTGALAGTTGVDGNFTIAPHTDGYIYLENRAGGSRQVVIDIMGSAT